MNFFAYINLIQGMPGLCLHACLLADNDDCECHMTEAELLKIQTALFNSWTERFKGMADDRVDAALSAVPKSLWKPDLVRTALLMFNTVIWESRMMEYECASGMRDHASEHVTTCVSSKASHVTTERVT